MMILYAPDLSNEHANRLFCEVYSHYPASQIIHCDSIDFLEANLLHSFHTWNYSIRTIILFISTGEELMELIKLYEWLIRYKIILILPDSKQDTITQAHMLHPRFVSWIDSDFQDVVSVVKRMDEQIDTQKNIKSLSKLFRKINVVN